MSTSDNERYMLNAFNHEQAPANAIRSTGAGSLSHQKIDAPIDWQAIHAMIPWLAVMGAWVMWAMFLLIPTAFSLHYAGMFPAANNWLYVLMGMVLCLAALTAAQKQDGVRAILFTFSVLLLSYWF